MRSNCGRRPSGAGNRRQPQTFSTSEFSVIGHTEHGRTLASVCIGHETSSFKETPPTAGLGGGARDVELWIGLDATGI